MSAPSRPVRAQRGPGLRCRGWRQEAILRLLENNLENAEDPDALVVYMSTAKAARDWESYERIAAVLQRLQEVVVHRLELDVAPGGLAVRSPPELQQLLRVVLLRPVVAALHTGDEDLEPLRVAGVARHRLGA